MYLVQGRVNGFGDGVFRYKDLWICASVTFAYVDEVWARYGQGAFWEREETRTTRVTRNEGAIYAQSTTCTTYTYTADSHGFEHTHIYKRRDQRSVC